MIFLGIDLETTGLDLEKSRIVEIAAISYDSDYDNYTNFLSKLLWDSSYTQELWTNAEKIHGIPRDLCQKQGATAPLVLMELITLMEDCHYVVAHNGINYDKPILENECNRWGLKLPKRPWIDTSTDIAYPENIQTRRLNYLLTDHDIYNPVKHRAIFDVFFMMELFRKYPLDSIVKRASSPTVQAIVSCGRENKPLHALLKSRRFRFDGKSFAWVKLIKQCDLEEETKALGGVEPAIIPLP